MFQGFKPDQLGPAFTKAFKRLDEELLAKLRLGLSPVEVNNDHVKQHFPLIRLTIPITIIAAVTRRWLHRNHDVIPVKGTQ
jgi:hypothetical protein